MTAQGQPGKATAVCGKCGANAVLIHGPDASIVGCEDCGGILTLHEVAGGDWAPGNHKTRWEDVVHDE